MLRAKVVFVWFAALAPVLSGRVQASPSAKLQATLKRIFETEDFKPEHFGPSRWLETGGAFTTIETSKSVKDGKDIVRYDVLSGNRQILVPASELIPPGEKEPLTVDDYAWSEDGKELLIFTNAAPVWRQHTRGDYWLLRLEDKALRKLGGNGEPSTMMFAQLSPDGTKIAFVRHNNIFVQDLQSYDLKQLTQDGSPTLVNGTSDWVYEEEFDLRNGLRWSPDNRSIAFWKFDSSGVGSYPLIDYTDSIYPTIKRIPYPKAGTTNSAVSIHVVDVESATTTRMKVEGDPRQNYIPRMEWPKDSKQIVMIQENRLQNTADLLLGDPTTGEVKRIFRDQDKAWVDVNEIRPFGDGFVWLSERDGWRHAYFVPRDGGKEKLLTPGSFDIIRLTKVAKPEQPIYFNASPENATQSYLYETVEIDGKPEVRRVTPSNLSGSNTYDISPDEKWAIHTFSRADDPPRAELVQLPDHQTIRSLYDNAQLREKLNALFTERTEFIQIDIGGGTVLDGAVIRPSQFDPSRKYPLLVYVYGEPASQTVLDSWTGARDLFHRALADDGYIVASFDNRGTPAPKGREWRKVIYGSVGPIATQEQTAAVKKLCEEHSYIDRERIGVWGWSGGGTDTLNLMFRSPDVFKVGMAVAPVPDQRLYDTIYQERYMGLPQDNPDGYKRGSAINFAGGLQGHLLLVHGTGDDNVHFQGSQMLINKLVELGKPFDFMEYPNRTHAISEGKGTSIHLFMLLARYLEDHLPAGPRVGS